MVDESVDKKAVCAEFFETLAADFVIDGKPKTHRCRYCDHYVSNKGTGYANLWEHMRRYHANYKDILNELSVQRSDPNQI